MNTPTRWQIPAYVKWISALALLAVGLKSYQVGLSIDGPVYATVARNVARTGEWFRLDQQTSDLQPYFAEQPHLGMWVMAGVFRLLNLTDPTKVRDHMDWAARIPAQFFYWGYLLIFYAWLRRRRSENVALVTVLVLWTWDTFSSFFSNSYLDPGTTFFQLVALVALDKALRSERRYAWAALSGFSLAATAMYKGFSVLGIGPACAYVLLFEGGRGRQWSRKVAVGGASLGTAAVILAAYAYAVFHSNAPDFFQQHWSRVMDQRFKLIWDWSLLFHPVFWKSLIKDTKYMWPFAVWALVRLRGQLLLPLIWFFSFILMYFPAARYGLHYWLMLMPPLAWLIAEGMVLCVSGWLTKHRASVMRATTVFSVGAVLLLQMHPVKIKVGSVPATREVLMDLRRRGLRELHTDFNDRLFFAFGVFYAWYADLRVIELVPGKPPSCTAERAVMVRDDLRDRYPDAALRAGGCCPLIYDQREQMRVWTDCKLYPEPRVGRAGS